MTGLGLGERARAAGPVRDLQRGVAVTLGRLDLDDPGGRDLDDGDRDGAVLVVPDLRHADLLADDRLGCHLRAFFRPFSALFAVPGGGSAGADCSPETIEPYAHAPPGSDQGGAPSVVP